MYLPTPGEFLIRAEVREEEMQAEAAKRHLIREARGLKRRRSLQRLQNAMLFIGTALLPLGESLRRPLPESRTLDTRLDTQTQ